MCQYVIELTGLTKKYGDFTAVNDLNLQIRKGEIFGLLDRKSTRLNSSHAT